MRSQAVTIFKCSWIIALAIFLYTIRVCLTPQSHKTWNQRKIHFAAKRKLKQDFQHVDDLSHLVVLCYIRVFWRKKKFTKKISMRSSESSGEYEFLGFGVSFIFFVICLRDFTQQNQKNSKKNSIFDRKWSQLLNSIA